MMIEEVKTIAQRMFWYPLIRLHLRLRAEREVGFVGNPILVYQMGKVGSGTVTRSLLAAGAKGVFHLHFLAGNLSEKIRIRQNKGLNPDRHLFISQAIKMRMRHPRFRCKIITLVREPIARRISDLFQNYRLTTPGVAGADGRIDPQRALDYLHDHLESLSCYNYAFNWFDNELKAVFGVDVFVHAFDKEAGYARIKSDWTDVLVARLENLSQLLPTVVSSFTGYELKVLSENRRADTIDADTYRTVTNNVRVSPDACRRIYETPFVQHFYSESMIVDFIGKWSR